MRVPIAYSVLRWTFGLLPIVVGVDKFFNILTHWEGYLSPLVTHFVSADAFLTITAVFEIALGLFVLFIAPRLGAWFVSLWLLLITINLITIGLYDIALRDGVLALSAAAFALLAPLRK